MLLNYFLIAYRNIIRHKLFSFINVFGLSLSMALCLIAIMQISHDLGYDHFHPHPERTYRILTKLRNPQGNEWKFASSPLPLRNSVAGEAEATVQLYPALNGKAGGGDKTLPVNGCFTDPSFFTVFGFTLAKGNMATALQSPNSMVLSHEMAQRFFGKADPIGKIITTEALGSYQVTGVLQPQTASTHIEFDAYASASTVPRLEKEGRLPRRSDSWNSYRDAYTYILLPENRSEAVMTASLERLAASLVEDPSQGSIHFLLQPLNRITPTWDDVYNNFHRSTTWGKMMAAAGIAFIILLSACFNYTNLSIARSLTRAKEVGIRKVSGATRLQVFAQYIMEAVLVSLLSLLMALLLVELNKRFHLLDIMPDVVVDWRIYAAFLAFSLFTGLLAGSLPAWILSSFNPVQVLKNIPSFRLFGRMSLRRGLLVFQLSLSLVLTVFLFAFYRQFTYMADADPGYDAQLVLSVQLQGNREHLLAQEVAALSSVESVAATSRNPGRFNGDRMPLRVSKDNEPVELSYFHVDAHYVPQMGLKMLAGNNFLPHSSSPQLIVNEKAAASLGFATPFDAVGQRVWINDSSQAQITGVLKDFHFENMGAAIAPVVFRADTANFQLLNIKVKAGAKAQAQRQVSAIWNRLYPDQPVQTYWLGEKVHEDNAQVSSITSLGFLAMMTIVIAMLGLLAMVIYTTALRRKEISVRKVMGAGVPGLVLLLSRGFMKLILIAGCIALPLGYLASDLFLRNFALRTPFGAGSVLLCFLALVLITLLTIVSQTWKAALVNPADNLRSE